MSANTVEANRNRFRFDDQAAVWLFGYGSLIFKADFPYIERRGAAITGWSRRFWQGSHDHRGTLEAPGRVVTLIESAGSDCKGMAYLVSPEVFEQLDFREKNGYLRFCTDMTFDDCTQARGLVYIATPDNSAFLGPASESEIARQIAAAAGPSGPNADYLLHLAESLRHLGDHDAHVFEIETQLRLALA
ncbi:gamma-glutamylcyclotransferase [Marinobacterium rhizophilum]|uniref:glutathione-specific gamma-glutamylcyclotransferase n=1 Tax=Marinobacterium rhizophilum TaxID=420402 RepID=A0ABY5HNU4_9GAMM|nr:gamma-glutamylcyclotransferase [Marinobacterium rhizophilum]UTW12902.1 gamma-glutamylcyclotransferase [Marinobacterium rhizophilum]